MSLKVCLNGRATSARLLLAEPLRLRRRTSLGRGRRNLWLRFGENRVLRCKGARRTETSSNESVGILCAPAAGDRLSPCGIPAVKGGNDAIFNDPERCADALKESTIVTYDKECALTIE